MNKILNFLELPNNSYTGKLVSSRVYAHATLQYRSHPVARNERKLDEYSHPVAAYEMFFSP